jgi:SNF family Na+-dependent transporter
MELDLQLFQLQEGIQMIFVFFPEALSKLPVAQIYSFLFFTMISFVIFNSEVG